MSYTVLTYNGCSYEKSEFFIATNDKVVYALFCSIFFGILAGLFVQTLLAFVDNLMIEIQLLRRFS